MTILTIPRKLSGKGELILVPRRDYERLLKALKGQIFTNRLERDLEAAIQEINRSKVFGPFSSARELKQSLEK